jgi:enolase-phosphatase E1
MIKAIVTDIEGTTSSISFVHEVLFPYARARMREFVRSRVADPQVADQLAAVREMTNPKLDADGLVDQLLAWIDQDKKVTPLKALQGLIWEQGYHEGDFYGDIYPDAVENLKKWHAQGIALYVYSSGSVHAQKLLFGHTKYGDLTPLFSGYFDTRIGAKAETGSYQHIVQALNLPAEEILFLSDIQGELDAARTAGLKTCWLVRDSAPDKAAAHPQVHDFNAIDLETLSAS